MRKTSLAIFTILLSIGLMGCGADGKENKSEEKEVSEDGEKQSNEGKEAKSVYTVESYIKSVEKNLAANSETLISNMKELQTYTIYSKVELLDFMAFIDDPADFEVSIRMFSMDRQANEVFKKGKDADVFSGSREMIKDVKYIHLFGDQNDEFWAFYDENGEAIELAEKQAMAAWVADCWKKANGQAIKLPAYFSIDDDDESYDLNKNQWVDDQDKWD